MMERQFGYDLSSVRIHTASPAADAFGAKAFASGPHICFATGHGPADHGLLAHEMSHVVEQATGGANGGRHDGVGIMQFDLEEDVVRELRKLPSAEEEGLSDTEQQRRAKVIFDRRDRLRKMFGDLSREDAVAFRERLDKRKTGDNLSEKFHDILAEPTRRGLLLILDDIILEAPYSESDFCKPYTAAELRVLLDHADSKAMFEFVDEWIAMVYGDETAELYNEYLAGATTGITPVIFDKPSSEIVSAFIKDPATRRRQEELLSTVEKAMSGKCPSLPEGVWTDVDLTKLASAADLNKEFTFGGSAVPTLPGLIAGGISLSNAGKDSRSVSGMVQMLRTVVAGKTTSVKIRTKFHFVVRDAIDFCPGNPGNWLAQSITVPMSRLEASGFASDVPFEVHYDAPTIERNVDASVAKACFGP
jgi:hypothetical protein